MERIYKIADDGSFRYCPDCGAAIGDRQLHDAWHDRLDRLERRLSLLETATDSVPAGFVP